MSETPRFGSTNSPSAQREVPQATWYERACTFVPDRHAMPRKLGIRTNRRCFSYRGAIRELYARPQLFKQAFGVVIGIQRAPERKFSAQVSSRPAHDNVEVGMGAFVREPVVIPQ